MLRFGRQAFLAAVGRGWLAHVPAMELPDHVPDKEDRALWDDCYRPVDARFWTIARNAHALVDMLGREPLAPASPVEMAAPPTTLMEARLAPDASAVVVHVVTYDRETLGSDITVTIRHPRLAGRARRLTPVEPDAPIESHARDNRLTIRFPSDSTYTAIVAPVTP